MPVTAMLVALVAGLAVWGVLDQVQSRQVGKIFSQELESQLHLQARESLIRFDRYLDTYGTTTRLLANHRRLAEYLEPLFWSENTAVEPVIYQEFRPFWLPDFFGRDALRAPSHVLLVDTKGRVREVFQAGSEALPEELRAVVSPQFLDPSAVRLVPVRFGEQLYLLISDAVEDSGGYPMGHLVVLLAIDDAFMAASQRGIDPSRAAVALVDGDDQRILASLDSATLIPGTSLDLWTDGYLVTSQSLTGYEGTDTNLLFATFVPQTIVERMQRHVRIFERRQRFYAALAFILVFTGVIYLVSARLNQVLKRMTRFSQRALGIVEPGFAPGGNQLLLLEEWIKHFTELVLAAREEMNRRHQAEMRESEALKAAMMEASLDSIVTLDHKGRIVEVNPAAERAFGLSRGDAMGLSFAERFLPDGSRAAFLRLLERAGHSELEPQGRGELGALRADGREFPVEISIVPIGSDSERFHTLYIHDVTSRKQAEREIKSLARFVAESPNPILRVTASGVVAYANNASQPLLAAWGIERGEPLSQEWAGEVLEAMERGEPREREIDLAGQVFALLFAPIRDLGYANIYARDITAVRRAEQQSRQHQAELVHVSRLSTMGEVATGMAHELNQPLSAIVNYANGCSRRIQNGVGDSAELLGALDQVKSQAQRAGEIIRRLRALVGKQPPIRTDGDLNALVREVCGFLEFETDKLGIQIALELDPEPIPVHVDLVQIEQVLLNLVRNGLDALEDVPEDRRSLTIRTGSDGAEHAMVSVADTGPGVGREALLQLFDPFYTTKPGGMGMGLAISQTIVENHDGRIWAESEPHRGTVFHVILPLARVPVPLIGSGGDEDDDPDGEDAPPETAREAAPSDQT